ncbi:hypothetical protein QCA50_010143 [Cerrena zonata]|uniref:Uncharacterized protein n=1 Tax=Cerrena zonata TaxID=2478898 RepID=A0AAW0FYE9_9APHY
MSESSGLSQPPQYRPIGVVLAVGSGLLIGSSFVFKKKGLLSSQNGQAAGEGVAYLKSPMWWTGMIIMILGELCNFAAYAFVEAIIVTPMGALSVVISALLSHFFLGEKLSLFGVNTIIEFRKLFVTPWFLSYGGVVIVVAIFLAVYAAPKWGQKSMLPYIGVCSLIGGLSVSCTQGLGACILTSIRGENQILYKGLKASASQIITIVLAFLVICTGIFILQMSKVDPRKLSNVDEHTTLLLEVAKQEVDPMATRSAEMRRSSTLRSRRSHRSMGRTSSGSATRTSNTSHHSPVRSDSIHTIPRSEPIDEIEEDEPLDELEETRHIVERTEEPGMDSLRGVAGAIGTIIRARRRARELSAMSAARSRTSSEGASIHDDSALRSVGSRGSTGSGRPTHWFQGLWSNRPSQFRSMDDLESEKQAHPANSIDVEKGNVEKVEVVASPLQESPDSVSVSTEHVSGLPQVQGRMSTSMRATTAPSLRSVISDGRARTSSVVHFEDTRSMSAPLIPSSRSLDTKSEEQGQ